VATLEAMALMFRIMSAQCPTTQIGITSRPRATVTPSQARQAIVQETIQEMHAIMELVTQSIQVRAEDSITTTAMDIRHTYLNVIFGNCMKDSLVDILLQGGLPISGYLMLPNRVSFFLESTCLHQGR